MITFQNLDGKSIMFSEISQGDTYKVFSIMNRMMQGYKEIVPLRGAPGLTELCMHIGTAYTEGIVAFCNERKTYAYVLFADGRIVDGSFHQFDNGTWNIS